MPALLTLLTGPPQSGKTTALLERYRRQLAEGRPGEALWLSPTWRAAAAVRDRILDGGIVGCFRPGIMTFARFAQAVLDAAPLPIRPLSQAMKRQLVRQIIDTLLHQGCLHHFRPIAQTGGLVDLVCQWLSELKRLEIWPEQFQQACQARGQSEKDRELFEIYLAYQQALREHHLYDAEGRFWSARDRLNKTATEGDSPNFADHASMVPEKLGQSPPPFEALRFVVADGFTDFTRTQHEILELLAGWAEEIVVSLPLEPAPCRADLFSKPLNTLAELQRRHARCRLVEQPRMGATAGLSGSAGITVGQANRGTRAIPSWPALAHLEQRLFTDPRREQRGTGPLCRNGPSGALYKGGLSPFAPADAPTTAGLEILAAAGPLGELEMIASRIKRLLVEGLARPQDVAVVFRTPQDSAGPAGEIFARYGIPVAWQHGPTLDRSPFLRALAALLRLDLEDWPFYALLSVLGSNYFQPDWPEWENGRSAILLTRALRQLQIPQGRQTWRGQHAVLERLAAAFDALPTRATLSEWADAWRRLAEETGMFRAWEHGQITQAEPTPRDGGRGGEEFDAPTPGIAIQGRLEEPALFSDFSAWEHLKHVVDGSAKLARWLDRRLPELDRRQAYQALVDILGSDRLPVAEDDGGRVRILSADSIRALHVPYVFLAGLAEKSFPLPDHDDRLYSETESLRLIEQGLPLANRTQRNRDEMLLFYEAVTRATKGLYLSYPAYNEAAEPLSPSPFLIEVEQACGATPIACRRADDFRPLPKTESPLCPADFRVQAMARALEGDASWLAALFGRTSKVEGRESGNVEKQISTYDLRPSTSNLRAGLETAVLRQDRRFGPADGVFYSPAAQVFLHQEYSPQRTFAATELERYAACPFCFLLEHVLQITPPEDLSLQADVRRRGEIVHEVLAGFHQRVNQALGRPGSPAELEPPAFTELMEHALQAAAPSAPGGPLAAALAEIDRRLAAEWLADYREQSGRYDRLWKDCQAPLVPEFFEISFGRSRHRSTTWAVDEPLVCETPQGTIRVAGRIDRVDTGRVADHAVFNVIDYKTGRSAKFSKEAVLRGTALQLPLYAITVPELFLVDRDPLPWEAGYWIVSNGGFKSRSSLKMYQQTPDGFGPLPDWEEIRLALRSVIGGLVRNLRQGRFPVFNLDEKCTSHCPYRTVCRIGAIRSLEKTWNPPGENPVSTPEPLAPGHLSGIV
ncbi:MAG: PD-(D/E)XK nuclease family protein [Pirellulales bacterium]|nr:PD-(D/E)XK nuclease family protein [Pirellulales bacterium]